MRKYLGKDTDVKIVTEACKVQKSRCFSKCKYGDRYYSFLILPIDTFLLKIVMCNVS